MFILKDEIRTARKFYDCDASEAWRSYGPPRVPAMSEGDFSALLTLLAVPAGGAIAAVILWAVLRRRK